LKEDAPKPAARLSSLVDTRVIYCGDSLEQLRKLPDACVDLSPSAKNIIQLQRGALEERLAR
jgi:hypothetical protein